MTHPTPTTQTHSWIQTKVISLNLCPFAKYPFQNDTIRYIESDSLDTEHVLLSLYHEFNVLSESSSEDIETVFIILSEGWKDFEDYLSLIDIAQSLLVDSGLNCHIQIATFHPDYQFADLEKDDVRNYTNRSPYPMIHLLREASVRHAIESYPDVDSIPVKNQEKLQGLGIGYFESE